jgi:mevalonate pyrophosphate decarboxylase
MSLQLYNSSVFFGSPIYIFPIPDAPTALTLVSTTPSSITVSVTAPAGEVYGYYAYTSLVYTGEANYLYINGGNQNGNYSRMNAYYDNIRLYNRALTANEVSAMYTYENSTPTA